MKLSNPKKRRGRLPRTALWLAFWAILTPGAVHPDVIIGLEWGGFSVNKNAEGVYRPPSLEESKEINYSESMSQLGFGPLFEVGFEPGKASLRIAPLLASGQVSRTTTGDKTAFYDLMGFTETQIDKLGGKSRIVTIEHKSIGTEFMFKYNAPSQIPGKNQTLKIIRQGLEIMNPWIGLGSAAFTHSRLVSVSGVDEFVKKTYVDFNFLLAGGFNIQPHYAWKEIPRNLVVPITLGMIINLTPEDGTSVHDDTLNFTEKGFYFRLGVGYGI